MLTAIFVLAQFVGRYMNERTNELDDLYWHACLLDKCERHPGPRREMPLHPFLIE